MKKSLIFASIACAGAFALHADNWTYQDWFTGIGTGATATNDMKATNGAWNFSGVTSGTVSYDSGLVFELEDTESIAFNVVDGTAPDTNTWTDVKVSGVFTPVSTNDLPNRATMEDRSAQVGFVVGINDEPGTNYYAWVGGDDWVKLTGAVNPATVAADAETTLLVTFDYTAAAAAKARFAILTGSGATTTNFLEGGSAQWQTLATSARKVSGLSCYGSGKLVAANGDVGLGVAEMDGKKYGSLYDAVTAAGESGEAKTIAVVRPTDEAVSLPAGSQITLEDNGNVKGEVTVPSGTEVKVAATDSEVGTGVSGSYSIPLNVTADAGDVAIVLPGTVGNYKEAVHIAKDTTTSPVSLKFDLRTKTEIITNAIPTGGKALEEAPEKLHQFLADYGGSNYTKAEATTADIKTALETVSNAAGSNGLPNWECYVLGITPTTSIVPVAAAEDTSDNTIPLSIPAVESATPSGDYTVKYQVGSGTAGGAIAVPASTGTHTIKIVLE